MEKERVITAEMVRTLFPKRKADTNKGSYGTAVIIGGSARYVGAPYLASLGAGALRVGTGIVRVAVPTELLAALQARVTDCTLFPLNSKDGAIDFQKENIEQALRGATAVLCGCGLTTEGNTRRLIEYLVTEQTAPLILDADALNLLSGEKEILSDKSAEILITPHLGEMSRLCGESVETIKKNKTAIAVQFANRYGVAVLLKDSESVVTDGRNIYLNRRGTPAMAKGGSGDLLGGAAVGLAARGLSLTESGFGAAYLAGAAAELAVKDGDEYSLLVSETAVYLKQAVSGLING